MPTKHVVTGTFRISEIANLEQVSLFRLSQVSGVPVERLRAPANAMPLAPPPLPLLLPGPVPIHVDGVRFFTPTELGGRIGLSPQKFNRLLVEHGLQEKRDGQWCPTEAGKAFAVLLQVHKKQQAGTDVQQLKWKESVLAQLDGLA